MKSLIFLIAVIMGLLVWHPVEAQHAPTDSLLHLGKAYLQAGNLKQARASFGRALRLDHRLSEAYYGLGLVFRVWPKGKYDAIRYFQKALQYQPDHIEARFHMAEVRYELKEYDTRQDLERVLELDANYAPAYKLLGRWYEWQEDDGNAALAYARYLALSPEDMEARELLSRAYLKCKNFDRIVPLLEDHVQQHPDAIEALPILAQACMEQNRLEWAQNYFLAYIEHLPSKRRALYEDIQFLASQEELAEFTRLKTETEQVNFLRRFWSCKDPNLTTLANERWLEHCRRVWYALTNFSEGKQPFDRRGDVYIRFGEPDYRSRSDKLNLDQSLAVQQVRTQMAQMIYGIEAAQKTYFGPVYPVRGLQTSLSGLPDLRPDVPEQVMERIAQRGKTVRTNDNQPEVPEAARKDVAIDGVAENALQPTASHGGGMVARSFDLPSEFQPVSVHEDASMVRWETWVYADLNIEVTFTDEAMTGVYDYAPPPLDVHLPIRRLALLNRYNPQRVAELAARLTPDYYMTPENTQPLTFYYDLADFQGEKEETSALEVYTGIPQMFGRYFSGEDTTRLVVERTVALVNEETGDVYRRCGDVHFQTSGDFAGQPGAFVPDVLRLEVPPGRYRLEVSLRDRFSGRHGRYRQMVDLKPYPKKLLAISDLELAFSATEGGPEDQFRKDQLHVVPMPTRTYASGKSLFVYYELYNLKPEAFGQTRYQVEYAIGPKTQGIGGAVSRLVRTLGNKQEHVALGYEQAGSDLSEKIYTELNLGTRPPGKYVLKITITDPNSGETASKEAVFIVAK